MTAETFRCGHPKTPENCGVRPNGETWCRACSRIRAKAYRVANPEKAKASHKARTRAENQRLADEAWAARLAGGAPEPPVGSPTASDILTGTDGPPAVEKLRKALS